MKDIYLPRKIVNQILTHAQSSSAEEICGFISQKAGEVMSCYPIQNSAKDPAHFFQMDAKAQIDAMRKMRENGEELLAIYHSHPNSEAYPSATDLQESQYPEANYLIVSLGTKGVLDLRAYRLSDGKVEPIGINI